MNMSFGSLAYVLLLTFMVCSGKSLNFHSNDGLKHKYGGRYPVPVDDQHIVDLSSWAAEKLGGELTKITHAEEQVVSGLMYYIDMEIAFENYDRRSCSVKVWVQEWHHSRKLMFSRCRK